MKFKKMSLIVASLLLADYLSAEIVVRDPKDCNVFDVGCVSTQFGASDYGVWAPEKGAILYYSSKKTWVVKLLFDEKAKAFYEKNPWAGLEIDLIMNPDFLGKKKSICAKSKEVFSYWSRGNLSSKRYNRIITR